MIILIDADSCDIIEKAEAIARKHGIECHIFHDTTRLIETEYAKTHIVDKCKDSADMAILKMCENNNAIVITNDSGLAAMVKAMKGRVVNPSGYEYTNKNISKHLNNRYLRKQEVKITGRKQVRGIQGIRIKKMDFTELMDKMIREEKKKEQKA